MSSVAADGGRITIARARPDEARRLLYVALLEDLEAVQATFGPLTYRRHIQRYASWLEANGARQAAARVRDRGPDEPPAVRPRRRPRKG